MTAVRPHRFFWITLLLALSLPSASRADEEDEELLDPSIAFAPSGSIVADGVLSVHFDIHENYYLYKHGFKFNSADDAIELGQADIPPGKVKEDEWFGEVETYHEPMEIRIPWQARGEQVPQMFFIEVGYQGCESKRGVCFPPQKQLLQFITGNAANPVTKISTVAASDDTVPNNTDSAGKLSEQDRIAAKLTHGMSWLTLLTFFGFGLLLTFTPCVFPMIPILSGIIIGQGKSITTQKAFTLSLIYVLAMALTYTVAGIIVGLQGENIQALFQSPLIISLFAFVFVLLSLSMFGFYELQMPSAIQSRLTAVSNSQQGGTLIGAAIMGFLSALIVGPCVTAPLIGALIYIAQTGDAVLGGAALFSLSLGMGLPLILIGTVGGKLLPKAGTWMNGVKAFFGVMLLAVAIWLLDRIVPATVTMILYAILLITSSVYMGALEPLREGRSSWYALWKGLGLIMLLYGALLIIGAAAGSSSMLHPLRNVAGSTSDDVDTAQHSLPFQRFKGVDGLNAALDEAILNNQPVMLDLYADWCVSCKEMEAFTFSDPTVQESLTQFMLIQSDLTANDDADKALLKHLGEFGPPAIIFYDSNGNEIKGRRVVGYMNAETFISHLQQLAISD